MANRWSQRTQQDVGTMGKVFLPGSRDRVATRAGSSPCPARVGHPRRPGPAALLFLLPPRGLFLHGPCLQRGCRHAPFPFIVFRFPVHAGSGLDAQHPEALGMAGHSAWRGHGGCVPPKSLSAFRAQSGESAWKCTGPRGGWWCRLFAVPQCPSAPSFLNNRALEV